MFVGREKVSGGGHSKISTAPARHLKVQPLDNAVLEPEQVALASPSESFRLQCRVDDLRDCLRELVRHSPKLPPISDVRNGVVSGRLPTHAAARSISAISSTVPTTSSGVLPTITTFVWPLSAE